MDGATNTTATAPAPSAAVPPKKVAASAGDSSWDNIIRMAAEGLSDNKAMEKSFLAQRQGDQALLKHLADWEPPAPPKDPIMAPAPQLKLTSPLEAFGQFGTMFAVMGSLLTRRPLVNGLNAAAGAINAVRKNDYDTYLLQMQNWKDQTDYTFKLADYQNTRYRTIIDSHNADVNTKIAFIRTEAAANHDWLVLKNAELGDLQLIEQTIHDRDMVLNRGRNAYGRAYSMGAMLGDLIKDYRDTHDGKDPPPQLVGIWNHQLHGSGMTGKTLTIGQVQKNAQIVQAQQFIAKLQGTPEGKAQLDGIINGNTPPSMLNPAQKQIADQYKLAQQPLFASGQDQTGVDDGTDGGSGDGSGGDGGQSGDGTFSLTTRPTAPGAVIPVPADFAGDPDGQKLGEDDNHPQWEKHGDELWWIGDGNPPAGATKPPGDNNAPAGGPPYGDDKSKAGVDWFGRTLDGIKDLGGRALDDLSNSDTALPP